MARIVITGVSSSTDDHRELIQQALDRVEADGGGEVFIADGEHVIGPLPENQTPPTPGAWSLKLGNNVHLRLGSSATLVRRFHGFGENSTVRNKDLVTGNTNVSVTGGIIKRHGTLNAGKHLAFGKVTGLSVRDVQFAGVYGDWNTRIIDCEDVLVDNLVIRSGTALFEDGLHFAGGRRIVISNCIVECGDDALSLLNEATSDVTTPMEDVLVVNCYFYSRRANPIKIQVMNDAIEDQFPIRRVRIANVVAKAGDGAAPAGFGIFIHGPTAGSDMVADIEMDGVWLDASQNGGPPIEVQFAKRVRLLRVVSSRPLGPIRIDGTEDVELRDCVVDSPRDANVQCLLAGSVAGSTNLRIIGGRYRNAQQHAIVLGGAGGNSITGFELSGALIEGKTTAPKTLSGIFVSNATKGIISGNTIVNCDQYGVWMSGATSTLVSDNFITGCALWGILEQSPSNNNTFIANRLIGNTSGGLSMSGSLSEGIRNVTDAGKPTSDSGGFRQTADGWYKDGGLTGLKNDEIPRNNFAVGAAGASRFRAARSGSVTGIVLTSDVSQTKGFLQAEAYINRTGFAGGVGLPTGLTTQLDDTHRERNAATQPQGADTFVAGDEIYIVLTTSEQPPDADDWAPTTAKIRCAIEIED